MSASRRTTARSRAKAFARALSAEDQAAWTGRRSQARPVDRKQRKRRRARLAALAWLKTAWPHLFGYPPKPLAVGLGKAIVAGALERSSKDFYVGPIYLSEFIAALKLGGKTVGVYALIHHRRLFETGMGHLTHLCP